MRLIKTAHTKDELVSQLENNARGDYIYMYPPRQVYTHIIDDQFERRIEKSLSIDNDINLYFHFPFCRQVCSFCNLYTHICKNNDIFRNYIESLKKEVLFYSKWLIGKQVKTIYLGGGTPSLLPVEMVNALLSFLEETLQFTRTSIAEIAIEISPETVDLDKLQQYKKNGINRINFGVQSLSNAETKKIGRQYPIDVTQGILHDAKQVQFKNTCVDLIYGLNAQTINSWKASVEFVRDYAPETICAYPLTLRPGTGYSKQGYMINNEDEQYQKYDLVNSLLTIDGYKQETHVRWTKNSDGGYLQKKNHWALGNIIGFGAGARSYLWECDYRNGYSIHDRSIAFTEYMKNVNLIGHGRTDGICIDENERRRKAIVLGINCLDRKWYCDKLGIDPIDLFPEDFCILEDAKLITVSKDIIQLTSLGIRYRDVIVQRFFSSQVTEMLTSYSYETEQ